MPEHKFTEDDIRRLREENAQLEEAYAEVQAENAESARQAELDHEGAKLLAERDRILGLVNQARALSTYAKVPEQAEPADTAAPTDAATPKTEAKAPATEASATATKATAAPVITTPAAAVTTTPVAGAADTERK